MPFTTQDIISLVSFVLLCVSPFLFHFLSKKLGEKHYNYSKAEWVYLVLSHLFWGLKVLAIIYIVLLFGTAAFFSLGGSTGRYAGAWAFGLVNQVCFGVLAYFAVGVLILFINNWRANRAKQDKDLAVTRDAVLSSVAVTPFILVLIFVVVLGIFALCLAIIGVFIYAIFFMAYPLFDQMFFPR